MTTPRWSDVLDGQPGSSAAPSVDTLVPVNHSAGVGGQNTPKRAGAAGSAVPFGARKGTPARFTHATPWAVADSTAGVSGKASPYGFTSATAPAGIAAGVTVRAGTPPARSAATIHAGVRPVGVPTGWRPAASRTPTYDLGVPAFAATAVGITRRAAKDTATRRHMP